jgi:formate hydrogenlyase transcriptional activator
LLRVLQEQAFERLGSTRTINVNVRIIAATHRDLGLMMRDGDFRPDLFYRLNIFPIHIPSLRERREDIPLLVRFFVSRICKDMRKCIRSIPKNAMDALMRADWPGNIRQLENFIERCVILTQGNDLSVPTAELKEMCSQPVVSRISSFEDSERRVITEALRAASGKIAGKGGAAERLGLKRTTLQNKMYKLNISRAECAN